MKLIILNIALIAMVGFGATFYKNLEKGTENNAENIAEASEMAVSYKVDPAASQITWEGSKLTGTHYGTINISSGEIAVNNGTIEAGNFVIDMTSINNQDLEGDKKVNLEAHLKGTIKGKEGDFFNTTKYPNAKFEMTGIENNMVKGNLTIKEKTNAIEFPVSIKMEGDKLMLKSEPFKINRTKWDVNYGSKSIFLNLGDKFISDDIKITVSFVANKA